jgi:hypothetical protein
MGRRSSSSKAGESKSPRAPSRLRAPLEIGGVFSAGPRADGRTRSPCCLNRRKKATGRWARRSTLLRECPPGRLCRPSSLISLRKAPRRPHPEWTVVAQSGQLSQPSSKCSVKSSPLQCADGLCLAQRNKGGEAALGVWAAEGVAAKWAKTEDRWVAPTSPGWAPGRWRRCPERPVSRPLQPALVLPPRLLAASGDIRGARYSAAAHHPRTTKLTAGRRPGSDQSFK